MNTIRAPSEVTLEGFRNSLREYAARLTKLETQMAQMEGVGVTSSPKGLPRNYDYANDVREPTVGQLKTFRDLYVNVKGYPDFPPKEMPRGHIWLSIFLHYHPEAMSQVDPSVLEQIKSVIGEFSSK